MQRESAGQRSLTCGATGEVCLLARKLARQAPPVLIQSKLWRTLRCVSNLADAEPLLRGASLRVTQPRLAVLSSVQEHPHTDTDTLIGIVRAQLGAVSHQAVYDVLRVLTGAGLVRRIQPSGSVARFEARVRDNHHHVVCRSCGAMADVDCAVGDAPCLTASDDAGFEIDEAEVVYWGRCSACDVPPGDSPLPAAQMQRGTP